MMMMMMIMKVTFLQERFSCHGEANQLLLFTECDK